MRATNMKNSDLARHRLLAPMVATGSAADRRRPSRRLRESQGPTLQLDRAGGLHHANPTAP